MNLALPPVFHTYLMHRRAIEERTNNNCMPARKMLLLQLRLSTSTIMQLKRQRQQLQKSLQLTHAILNVTRWV